MLCKRFFSRIAGPKFYILQTSHAYAACYTSRVFGWLFVFKDQICILFVEKKWLQLMCCYLYTSVRRPLVYSLSCTYSNNFHPCWYTCVHSGHSRSCIRQYLHALSTTDEKFNQKRSFSDNVLLIISPLAGYAIHMSGNSDYRTPMNSFPKKNFHSKNKRNK